MAKSLALGAQYDYGGYYIEVHHVSLVKFITFVVCNSVKDIQELLPRADFASGPTSPADRLRQRTEITRIHGVNSEYE